MSPESQAAQKAQSGLRLDEKVEAENLLYAAMAHSGDNKVTWIAAGAAIALHAIILLVNFPDFSKTVVPQKPQNQIIVKKYVPPPPKVERRKIEKKQLTRKVPVPDPTPDEPEPIREPEPDIEPEPLPPDVEFLIGTPEAPPPSGPLLAGVGDVSNPIRDESSYVEPEYPELARVARLEGNVILHAVIQSDGNVGSVEVLRCTRPNMGFEEAAIAAVQEWKYQPAKQNGKPVDVYFTIVVEFLLH